MTEHDDSTLVKRIVAGDQVAFSEIVDKYQSPIFNAAFRIINNYDDAVDITQTVFIKAYEKLQSFKSKYKLFSWLYRIAINEALNFKNRRKQFESIDEEHIADEDPSNEFSDQSDINTVVQQALMKLSEDHRIVIILYHFQNLSYKEMSYVLDIPEKTVKSRLFTARKVLKEILIRERM